MQLLLDILAAVAAVVAVATAVEAAAEDAAAPDNGCDNGCSCLSPTGVDVTIGLFAVVKLLRLSNMSVNSYGNCMPCECSDISDISPCDFFDNLKFPTDLFAPQANYKPCCDTSSEDTPTNGSCCETC